MSNLKFDDLFTFDYTQWKSGKVFVDVKSKKMLRYRGILMDPITSVSLFNFQHTEPTNPQYMTFVVEYLEDVGALSSFEKFEEFTSLRPYSFTVSDSKL